MVKSRCCVESCLDAQNPLKLNDQWAESDARLLMPRISQQKENEERGHDNHNNTFISFTDSFGPMGRGRSSSFVRRRQNYLRSYTFCGENKESVVQKAKKKYWVNGNKKSQTKSKQDEDKDQKNKQHSCSFLQSSFSHLLTCVASVDVHE